MTVPVRDASPDLLRFAVPTGEQLSAIVAGLSPELRARPPVRSLHRDLYLDTPDDRLRRRGVVCRLRIGTDDRRILSLDVAPRTNLAGTGDRARAAVRATEPAAALAENTSPGRRVRALVDPAELIVRLTLDVDRLTLAGAADWLGRPRVVLHADRLSLRDGEVTGSLRHLCVHRLRGRGAELARVAELLRERFGLAPGAPHPREWAELRLKWARHEPRRDAAIGSNGLHRASTNPPPTPAGTLNADVGLVAFQERVLAMAEDPATPLRERLRFLAIVADNVDELHTVRVAGLRTAAHDLTEDEADDGLTAAEQLDLVVARLRALGERQARCCGDCLALLPAHGVRLVRWRQLSPAQQDVLAERFRDEIHPALTPYAVTLSPGHPLPHLQHLALSMAVMTRDGPRSAPRFSELALPATLPRFLSVQSAEGGRDVVPLEEVVRGNLALLHPHAMVEHAHLFRVTRGGRLPLDEAGTDDMLEAVAEAAGARPRNTAVRVEVEAGMPPWVCDLILEDLRREQEPTGQPVGHELVEPVEGLLDLRALADLPLPSAPDLEFPPFATAAPLAGQASMLDAVRERDLLAHHPFDRFDATVLRFLREAASDDDVTGIRITLYRVGEHSPVVEALTAAARDGKEVVAFVEVKARFEEVRNVRWARMLERAGGRVVYGLKGLKTHAKVALVVRREAGRLRRYAHIGTGNYNPQTARRYTDLSLFTANDAVTADVADLFNDLTGSAGAPHPLGRGSLVAPRQLLSALLERIEREAAHARAGRLARITMKVNGLSDPDVVGALCLASQAGVSVELICRGVCTLRPGVAGRSDGVRVISVVGRLLEHSRILRFENGGDPEYFIGSADLRPRNLRRRVELLVPVREAGARATLDALLALYLDDETGWELRPDGEYQRRGGTTGAQAALAMPVGDDVAILHVVAGPVSHSDGQA